MQARPGLVSARLEDFRALWEATHRAAYTAAVDTETDLASLVDALQLRQDSASSVPDLDDRGHVVRGWADAAAARLPRVRSGLTRRQKRSGRFSIVLFGRTQAGKSTIREVLMGGNGETIGKGAQQTTRRAKEYSWGECVIVDTPGIGAYGGAEDREQALAAAASADIVVFVLSSDGLQEDTFEGLAALRKRNIPIIFALNVRRDLTKPVYRGKFLADPAFVFRPEDLDGHIARIQRLASERLGLNDVAVFPIHAQAAHMGVTSEDAGTGYRLWEASRLDDLTAALSHEVSERAVVRRLQTTTDAVVCPMDELRLQAREHVRHLQREREALEVLEREIVNRARARWADGRSEASYAVKAVANKLRGEIGAFVDEYADDPNISSEWEKVVRRHQRRLQAQVQCIAEKTLVEVRTEVEALLEEIAPRDGFAAATGTCADPRRCSQGWEDAARWVSRVLLVVTLRLPVRPAIKIAAAVLSVVLEPILRFARAKRVAKLRSCLEESVVGWAHETTGQVRDWFARAESDLARQLRALVSARISVWDQLAADLENLSDSVSARVRKLNNELVASVAGLLGASPDSGVPSRVGRQPGRCAWLVWPRLQDSDLLVAIGSALKEEMRSVEALTRAQQVAALLKDAGAENCRVSVVNGTEAHVVLRDGLQDGDLPLATVILAEDLTGLRVTAIKET